MSLTSLMQSNIQKKKLSTFFKVSVASGYFGWEATEVDGKSVFL